MEELERLSRMVDSMLFLARAQQEDVVPVRENLAVEEAFARMMEFFEGMAEEGGLTLRCAGGGTVQADAQLLRRARRSAPGARCKHLRPDIPRPAGAPSWIGIVAAVREPAGRSGDHTCKTGGTLMDEATKTDQRPGTQGMASLFGVDAYSPAQIADRVEQAGVAMARLPLLSLLMLGVLAGAFIGLGALYFVIVRADPALGFAPKQLLGGVAFAMGLILVVVAGAELFTGNNLLVMAWADGKISTAALLRNWTVVFVGNFIGAAGLALLVFLSRHPDMNGGAIAREYLGIARVKVALPFGIAFFRGILCNALVCLAVWMALAGRSVVDKAVAIVVPVSAFVAAGFEHSVANLYLIPMAMLLQDLGGLETAHPITWLGFFGNLAPVLLGNIIGGSVLVGLVYHFIYHQLPGPRP